MDLSTIALVFDHLPEPMAILVGGAIEHRNRAWATKHGLTTALAECFHADERARVTQACDDAQRASTVNTTLVAANGKRQDCSFWSVGNDLVALRAIEIVEPTNAEVLHSPEKLLQWLFARSVSSIWTTLKDGTITISHGPGLALLGLTDGQMVGMNAFEVYPPGSYVLDVTNRALSGEEVHEASGDEKHGWNQFIVPMRDASGEVEAMAGFATALSPDTLKSRGGARLLQIVDELPIVVWAMDKSGRCTLSAGKLLHQMGVEPGQLVGANLFEVYKSAERYIEQFHRALAGESFTTEEYIGDALYMSHYLPEKNVFGDVVGMYSVTQDITALRKAEAEIREHEQRIASQAKALAEAISPIIEVWQGVLVVPLIGTLEQSRAALLTGKLLDDVVRHGATYTILDLTGVENVDAETANHLFQIMRSVELLGCSCLVSGIRGSVAQTMVSLDVPMQARTFPTLAGALRTCLRKARQT